MGLRFIIFLAAIWIVLLIIRFYLANASKKRRPQTQTHIETVRCQQCGLVIPKEEALQRDNLFFCSEAHRNG